MSSSVKLFPPCIDFKTRLGGVGERSGTSFEINKRGCFPFACGMNVSGVQLRARDNTFGLCIGRDLCFVRDCRPGVRSDASAGMALVDAVGNED